MNVSPRQNATPDKRGLEWIFSEDNPDSRRNFWITVAIVVFLIIFGCAGFFAIRDRDSQSAPVTAASATPALNIQATNDTIATANERSKISLTATNAALTLVLESSPTPIALFASTATPTVTEGYDYAGLPLCDKPDESTPLAGAIQNDEGLWEINIHENGCNLVFEGRIVPGERLHRVIVLRSSNGEMAGYVQNGVFTYAEGSTWQKKREKNMEDVTNVNDPAEALKLLNDKRAVMDANGYDFPIWLYFTDGTTTEFGPGETWEGLTAQNHCDLAEPVKINVHGEKLEGKNQFSAAIGATDCVTIAWIDSADTPEQWKNQRDVANKVIYVTIEAWLMPSIWSQDQIDAWIATQ